MTTVSQNIGHSSSSEFPSPTSCSFQLSTKKKEFRWDKSPETDRRCLSVFNSVGCPRMPPSIPVSKNGDKAIKFAQSSVSASFPHEDALLRHTCFSQNVANGKLSRNGECLDKHAIPNCNKLNLNDTEKPYSIDKRTSLKKDLFGSKLIIVSY